MSGRHAVHRRRAVVLALLAWGIAAFFALAPLWGRAQSTALRVVWVVLAVVWVGVGVQALRTSGAAEPQDAQASAEPDDRSA